MKFQKRKLWVQLLMLLAIGLLLYACTRPPQQPWQPKKYHKQKNTNRVIN